MIISRCDPRPQDARRAGGRVWRIFGYAFLLLLVLLAARLLIVRSFDSGPMPPPLSKVAQIPVTLPDGQQVLLGNTIRDGLPTVITLWASWCGPCRREAPKIAELRSRFGPNRLNLIYLNVREDGGSPQHLASYLSSVGMAPDAYAVMTERNIGRLTNDSQNLIPRTYVFDRKGTPVALIVGYKPLALARIVGLIDK